MHPILLPSRFLEDSKKRETAAVFSRSRGREGGGRAPKSRDQNREVCAAPPIANTVHSKCSPRSWSSRGALSPLLGRKVVGPPCNELVKDADSFTSFELWGCEEGRLLKSLSFEPPATAVCEFHVA